MGGSASSGRCRCGCLGASAEPVVHPCRDLAVDGSRDNILASLLGLLLLVEFPVEVLVAVALGVRLGNVTLALGRSVNSDGLERKGSSEVQS